MEASTSDLLYLIAEIAIATVALSGITMVLLLGGSDVSRRKIAMITIQLRMSSVVAIAAVIPLVVRANDFDGELMWRISSTFYVLMIFFTAHYMIFVRRLVQEMTTGIRILGTTPAVTSMLLVANLWIAEPWPYLTQLFIAWTVSLLLFLGFIQLILDERSEAH